METIRALAHLNKYLARYKWYLIWGIVFTFVSNLFGIFPAQLVRYALDLVRETLDIYYLYAGTSLQSQLYEIFAFTITLYGLLILALALLKGFFLFLVRQTLIVMSRHIEYDLKNDIYDQYQTLPLAFYRQHNTGDLMARISEDVGKVRMYVGPSIMYGMNLLVLFALVIGYMVSINVRLTIYVLLPLPILSVGIYLVESIVIKRSEEIQRALSQMSTYVQEAFSGIRVLKAFVQEDNSVKNFEGEANKYQEKSLRLTMVDALWQPMSVLLIGLSNVLVVYVGGQEVLAGRLTAGNITEFILYVNMLTWPVMALGWTTSQTQRAAASQQRINEFMAIKTSLVSAKNISREITGRLTFDHVRFVYPDTGIVALKDFSMDVQAGESVAILGTTGSGKSTLANLMMRMYDASSGEIRIDNVPIRDYDLGHLRGQMGYVPQDVFLFSDTISNNVRFGKPDMPQERVLRAIDDADLTDNIAAFPEAFETRIGERGITLSGGQKQRLSIARAIARDPKILILDDCLSAVDTNTENIILNNLRRIMADRTSVIISHRVSSAKLADKIIVLDNGEVKEQGTHEHLMALGGIYRELYDKQLQTEEA